MKQYLEYHPGTGILRDGNGTEITYSFPFSAILPAKPEIETKPKVDDIAKLKAAGFESQEIMQMIREGLI